MKTVALLASLSLVGLLGCMNNEEPAVPPPGDTSRAVDPTYPSTPPAETSRSMEPTPSSPTEPGMAPTETTRPGTTQPSMAQPDETPTMGSDMAKTDDQELKKKIQSALEVDPSLTNVAEKVQIETEDGKVTLRGSASSAKEKEEIASKVQQMEGVQEVDNQLQVASR